MGGKTGYKTGLGSLDFGWIYIRNRGIPGTSLQGSRKCLIDLELGSFNLINLHGVTQGSVPPRGRTESRTRYSTRVQVFVPAPCVCIQHCARALPKAPGREIERNLQSEGCRKAVRQQRFTATSKSSQTVKLAKAD